MYKRQSAAVSREPSARACATGNAVELEPGDDAVALATRLLSSRGEETIGGGPDGPPPT